MDSEKTESRRMGWVKWGNAEAVILKHEPIQHLPRFLYRSIFSFPRVAPFPISVGRSNRGPMKGDRDNLKRNGTETRDPLRSNVARRLPNTVLGNARSRIYPSHLLLPAGWGLALPIAIHRDSVVDSVFLLDRRRRRRSILLHVQIIRSRSRSRSRREFRLEFFSLSSYIFHHTRERATRKRRGAASSVPSYHRKNR